MADMPEATGDASLQQVVEALRRENERLRRENAVLQIQASKQHSPPRQAPSGDTPAGLHLLSARSSQPADAAPRSPRVAEAERQAQLVSANTIHSASGKAGTSGPPAVTAEPQVVELRSDTLTNPDAEMRHVIANAAVGDNVWGLDPTVKLLEQRAAEVAGKEAALFVPSGTMGNLVLVMAHCCDRVNEVILGDRCHQLLYEAGNLANVAGVQTRTVRTNDDGTLDLDGIKAALRGVDQHWPTTRAVLLENTHNFAGGRVLPMEYVRSVRQLVDERNAKEPADRQVALHCDGARAWHAAIALGLSMKEVLEPFDTASLCLSKALGAPVGSVIVGPHRIIEGRCRRLVKMLGGGMRQAGIIASAGLFAMEQRFARLADDHAAARDLAAALEEAGVSVVKPETNVLIWQAPVPDSANDIVDACARDNVMIAPIGPSTLRAIPHFNCGLNIPRVVRSVVSAHEAAVAAKSSTEASA